MRITELYTPSASQVNDILGLMKELNPDLAVTSEMVCRAASAANTHLFALMDGERIIGTASLCVYSSPTGQKASVEDVVVVSSLYRGQGLGVLLVQHLIDYARRELGNVDLHLASRPERVAANELYKKLGFEKRETNAYEMRVREGK